MLLHTLSDDYKYPRNITAFHTRTVNKWAQQENQQDHCTGQQLRTAEFSIAMTSSPSSFTAAPNVALTKQTAYLYFTGLAHHPTWLPASSCVNRGGGKHRAAPTVCHTSHRVPANSGQSCCSLKHSITHSAHSILFTTCVANVKYLLTDHFSYLNSATCIFKIFLWTSSLFYDISLPQHYKTSLGHDYNNCVWWVTY